MGRRTALRLLGVGATALATTADPPQARADTFVLGTTKPDASTTGVLPGSTLSVVEGDLDMLPGRTYQNLDVRGFVTGAAGSALINSRVRGRGTGYVRSALVTGDAGTGGFRVSRCTLIPDVPRYFLNAFSGANCVLERCDIAQVCDGAHVVGDNVSVLGNYLHDFAFFDGSTGSDHAHDALHPGWNHTDGVESLGGDGLQVVGNSIQLYISWTAGTPGTARDAGYPDGNYSNGVTLVPRDRRVRGFRIADNWMEGGDVLVQIVAAGKGYDQGNHGDISGNRCGADQHPISSGRRIQLRSTTGVGTFSGLSTNTFDHLPSVPANLRGGPLIADPGSGSGTPGLSYSLPA